MTEQRAREMLADCWQDLVEKDDRTSPEEYPEMALITRAELGEYLTRALPTPSAGIEEAAFARGIEAAAKVADAEARRNKSFIGSSAARRTARLSRALLPQERETRG